MHRECIYVHQPVIINQDVVDVKKFWCLKRKNLQKHHQTTLKLGCPAILDFKQGVMNKRLEHPKQEPLLAVNHFIPHFKPEHTHWPRRGAAVILCNGTTVGKWVEALLTILNTEMLVWKIFSTTVQQYIVRCIYGDVCVVWSGHESPTRVTQGWVSLGLAHLTS